jgi:hypothetical protein
MSRGLVGTDNRSDQVQPLTKEEQSMPQTEIPMNPLARAYCSAVRAGQITEDSPSRQLADGAAHILRRGVEGTTSDELRVFAAVAEAVAELKEEKKQ